MKHLSFIAVIALMMMGGMTMKAQDYHPIVEDGKQWNVLFSYPWNPPEPPHRYTDIYKIEGDTLVDGVPYKVMYATRNEDLTGWNLWGFLRETEDGQVFSRRPSTSDEHLLYDFSMEVGDTICMCDYGFYECCMVVVEKGEILVNEEPRQQIVLEYPFGNGEQEVWIEGIGSLYGIIDSGSHFLVGGSTDLLCYYEDGDLIWQNSYPSINSCYFVYPSQHGDLVISPTTLTFESYYESQTIHLINQTDNPVTISDIDIQPNNNMLIVYATFPQTLQPNQSTEIEVELNAIGYKGYQTIYINITTSIGNKQVIVRVNEEAWDEGLQYIPMQGVTFDENTPLTQSFYLHNTNALQSITVYEIREYGTNYLEMVPSHSLPYEIPAGGFLEVAVTLVNFPEEQTVTHLYCHSSEGEESGYFFFIAGGLSNGGNGVHNIWKLLSVPGSLVGVNAQGDLFGTDPGIPGTLQRSRDEGETWETVFTGGFGGNLAIGNKGRMFLVQGRIVNYSDDNGDTWQQTAPINEGTGFSYFQDMSMYSPSNDTLVGWSSPFITWTLDGGATWDSTRFAFMEDYQEISDVLVNENGDVYLSIWYYSGSNMGVYHSTLSDMRNWELVAFEGVGIKDMEFDPEGNVVCGAYYGGEFLDFEHTPGFYAFWANSVGIAENGIVYKTAMTTYNTAVLAYSLDHGEHFYNTVENLPLWTMAPGGEDGFVTKSPDNHLYFQGNQQYWKSIPNADDIPNVIAFPSEWYYEIENENGSITYQYMYQAGDTIINDEQTHILVKINTLYDKGLRDEVTREYVYVRDGKVYWWNKTLEEFTVLYDFGAEEGDSWTIKVGTESLIMHVDAVETVEYEGKTYRMLRVSDVDDYFSGDIVCGIGHLTSFLPARRMDNRHGILVEGLRCYWIEDELVFKPGDEDCDAIYDELHGIEEEGPSTSSTGSGTAETFTVYPNPANGVLFVETVHAPSLPAETYRITNLMGQTVLSGNINADNQQINVSSLPQGMYFITFAVETRKFVVR